MGWVSGFRRGYDLVGRVDTPVFGFQGLGHKAWGKVWDNADVVGLGILSRLGIPSPTAPNIMVSKKGIIILTTTHTQH